MTSVSHVGTACSRVAVLALCALAIGCWRPLPKSELPPPSYAAVPDTERIAQRIRELDDSGCGDSCSGYAPLNRGEEALRWRLVLADSATRTLDVQYFIWKKDASGALLLDRLLRAADRGVRVRVLVDDSAVLGHRRNAAVLNAHPNIELRGFNPINSMEIRINHRMHNKLMIADNAVAIVGGRNVADEYFGLAEDYIFRDMDVVSVGPIAAELSDAFDLFWDSDWSYWPETIGNHRPATEEELAQKKADIRAQIDNDQDVLAAFGTEPGHWSAVVDAVRERLVFATARVLVDTPPTAHGALPRQVGDEVDAMMRATSEELFIVSPYLVPTKRGMSSFHALQERGVKVRILTNSLASNDVYLANAAYKHYRRPLLEAGVELYELRADSKNRNFYATEPVTIKRLGLHAKVVIFDRRKVFVGSMNLDPRSMKRNTEVGLVIDSPELAAQLLKLFERDFESENSWRVTLDEDEALLWESDGEVRKIQPARNLWQRFRDWLAPGELAKEQI